MYMLGGTKPSHDVREGKDGYMHMVGHSPTQADGDNVLKLVLFCICIVVLFSGIDCVSIVYWFVYWSWGTQVHRNSTCIIVSIVGG
jgi:hypothetical protein